MNLTLTQQLRIAALAARYAKGSAVANAESLVHQINDTIKDLAGARTGAPATTDQTLGVLEHLVDGLSEEAAGDAVMGVRK